MEVEAGIDVDSVGDSDEVDGSGDAPDVQVARSNEIMGVVKDSENKELGSDMKVETS